MTDIRQLGRLKIVVNGETKEYTFNLTEKGKDFFNRTLWWGLHHGSSIEILPSDEWQNKTRLINQD